MPDDVMLGSWEFCAPFCVGRSQRILTSDETRTVRKHHIKFIPYSTPAPHGTQRWIVYDLETANGTAMNGDEMATGENLELRDGDEVTLAPDGRQCVRLLIQFKDESHSHIVIKVLTRSVAVSVVQTYHSMNTPEAFTDRSPRPAVETETSVAATPGSGRSAMMSPSHILPGCVKVFSADFWAVILPCSHTFCGYSISKCFRNSLACPECRKVVKDVPVPNRALDELVERLVGHTVAYKIHVRNRAWMQPPWMQIRRTQRGALRSNVRTLWSFDTKLALSAYIRKQFGETSVAASKRVGLTETAVDYLSSTELIIATHNLLLDRVS
ncbi:hypothetical protein PsorP6_010098 [Peronosclerospora sorghi]|uniref:Uncharacterized protein n=1 Tax=Peronosclerospora sorghi TaxID=230839 RepID=A0ACC0VWW3_9STRA|nr:hypothetical protein PsorP6_010098 [Peronosclerospora sorghi]